MIFTEFRLRNFQGIGNKTIKFPFVQGITIFTGDNGTGKSTLPAEGMHFIFTGESYSKKKKDELVNWVNKKNCMAEFDFVSTSGIPHTVGRCISPDKRYIYKNNDPEDEIPYTDANDFNRIVADLLGIDKKIFEQTVFLSADFYQPFLTLTGPNKREFIKRMFSFQKYSDMELMIKDDIKEHNKEISDKEVKKITANGEMVYTKQQKDNEKSKLEDLIKYNTDIIERKRVAHDVKKSEIIGYDHEQHQKDITEVDVLRAELNMKSINVDIDEKKGMLKSVNDDVDIDEKIKESNLLYNGAVSNKKHNDKEILKFDKLLEENNKLNGQYSDVVDLDEKDYNRKAAKLLSELNQIGFDRREHEKIITDSKSKIEYYETVDVCGECGNVHTPESKKENTDKLLVLIDENQKMVDGLAVMEEKTRKDYDIASDTEKRIIEYNKLLIPNNAQMKSITISDVDYESIIDEQNNIINKHTTTRDEIDKIKNENSLLQRDIDIKNAELKKDMVRFDELKKNHSSVDYLSENEKLLTLCVTIKNQLKACDEALRHSQRAKDHNINIKISLSSLKTEIELLDKTISDSKLLLQNVNYDRVKELKKMIKKLDDQIKEKTFDVAVLNKLIFGLGDKGIKKYIIGKYVPLLNKLALKNCEKLGSKFMIKFERTGLAVEIIYRGVKRGYYQLSSGQRQRVNLAILFTFIQFNRIKSCTTFPFLSLDEVLDSSLDEEGIEALMELLSEMKKDIPYITVITHKKENLEFADRIVNVSTKAGFSQYINNATQEIY